MKMIILVACALVAIAAAGPVEQVVPQIITFRSEPQPDGGYVLSFETDDGTKRYETGEIREVTNEEGERVKILVTRGSYSYVDPEGRVQAIEYSADQDGFSAAGDSIPKVPESRR